MAQSLNGIEKHSPKVSLAEAVTNAHRLLSKPGALLLTPQQALQYLNPDV